MRDAIIINVVALIKSLVHTAEPAASFPDDLSSEGFFNYQSRPKMVCEPLTCVLTKSTPKHFMALVPQSVWAVASDTDI